MKIILSKNGLKREIQAPFAICVSAEDLDVLIKELQAARRVLGDSTYGWLRIDPSHPSDCSPNTRPLGWNELGNTNPMSEL